jgi:hypothetical protein
MKVNEISSLENKTLWYTVNGFSSILLGLFITYLLRPRETVCFVDPRPQLLPEAKPRATTAVEGPQNTLLSRGLSK